MSKLKKCYSNGRARGGTPGKSTDTGCKAGRNPKDYHRQEVAFHGSETSFNAWVGGGRKCYR